MNLQKVIFTITLCFGGLITRAQELPSISTDRPDQTESCFLVPAKHLQMEWGFNYELYEKDIQKLVAPGLLWRYGVNEQLELRMVTEVNRVEESKQVSSGFVPLELGVKLHIAEKKGWVPQTAFIGHIALPNVANESFVNSNVAPSFRFTMQHDLSDKLTLSYNLGMEWDGNSPESSGIYTLATGYSFTDKLGMYLELYGFMPEESSAAHNFDGGFTYLLTNYMQLDVSAGKGIYNSELDHYVSLGFSIRLPD